MSQVFKDGERLVLDLAVDRESGSGLDLQLLPSLLLGVLVPLLLVGYFAPEAVQSFKWLIWLCLIGVFVACTALFFYNHHFPGEIRSITVDRDARTLDIEWRNQLSAASQIVPFAEITALRMRHDYDDDGRPAPVAELILRSRAPIRLPSGITEQQLRPLRASIGLG